MKVKNNHRRRQNNICITV